MNVRFRGQCGHCSDRATCPLMTQSGQCSRGKTRFKPRSCHGCLCYLDELAVVLQNLLRGDSCSGIRAMKPKAIFPVVVSILAASIWVESASASVVFSFTASPSSILVGEEATLELRLNLNLLPDTRPGYLLESADFVGGHVAMSTSLGGTIAEFDVHPSGGFGLFQTTVSYSLIPLHVIELDPVVTVTSLQYSDKFVCIGFSCTPLIFTPIIDVPDIHFQTRLRVEQPPPPAEAPVPAALPLFAGGLGVIGLLARRRKKKQVT